jgi:CrcB protein
MTEFASPLLKPVLIFAGGGCGALARYWIGGLVQMWAGPAFPVGTLLVKVSGCLAMGFLATLWHGPGMIREEYRTAVLVGVLGGYTTFSSFGRETLALLQAGDGGRAAAYVIGSVALSLLAVWLGHAMAARLYAAGGS